MLQYKKKRNKKYDDYKQEIWCEADVTTQE
jgi:hypothetical protein